MACCHYFIQGSHPTFHFFNLQPITKNLITIGSESISHLMSLRLPCNKEPGGQGHSPCGVAWSLSIFDGHRWSRFSEVTDELYFTETINLYCPDDPWATSNPIPGCPLWVTLTTLSSSSSLILLSMTLHGISWNKVNTRTRHDRNIEQKNKLLTQ